MKKRMMKEWMTGARERLARQGETGRTFTGRTGRSAKRAALVAAALLSCAGMSVGRVSAEGSRDIALSAIENSKALNTNLGEAEMSRWTLWAVSNDAFMGVSKQQKVKFYAYAGEEIFLGSSAVKASTDVNMKLPDGGMKTIDLTEGAVPEAVGQGGHIRNRAQEKAGPRGVILPNAEAAVGADGFVPYHFTAEQSGIYEVEFKATSEGSGLNQATIEYGTGDFDDKSTNILAWDVTVAQNAGTKETPKYQAVNGRVWVDALTLETSKPVYGNLYAVTRDGYIWKVSLNGIQPYTFSMYANARGNIGAGTNASAYHSVHAPLVNYCKFDYYKTMVDKNGNPDGVYILGPDNDVTEIDSPYHMFLNYPDTGMPDSIVPSETSPMGEITSILYDGRDGLSSSDSDELDKSHKGYVGVGGYFEVETKGASSYRIIIDMSNMYAKYYHGEDKAKSCNGGAEHADEICLSVEGDDSFIYQDKITKQWYSLRTLAKNGDGTPNRHPVNDIDNWDETESYTHFEGLVKPVPIGAPDLSEYKTLGKVMLGNAAVDGTNRIYWNGRDQYGRILPVGYYFGGTGRGEIYAQAKAGEIHFPLGDAETIVYGIAVWLMNPRDEMLPRNQLALRSSLYYNHKDESILRDFTTGLVSATDGTVTSENGNNIWTWNLPQNVNNETAGEISINAKNLNGSWISGGAVFEDTSIDGVQSYSSENKLTGTASQFKGNGADHGVADVWTHILSTETKPLSTPIYFYHYANQKIVTGFVYLDTPKGMTGNTADGKYDKGTNDRELPGADVVAVYGGTNGKEYTFTTKTDSNGNYSIPIQMDNFDKNDTEQNVTITVSYDDLNVKESVRSSVSTYKVTTATSTSRQHIETAPNISVQTTSMVDSQHANKKEIYAEQVGYTFFPTQYPLRIQKIWLPSELKDNSMSASFTVKGIFQKNRNTGNVEQDPAFDEEDNVVYMISNISVGEALGGVEIIDSLPSKPYILPEGKKTKAVSSDVQFAAEDETLVYQVSEQKTGSSVTPTLKHSTLPSADGKITYDNWEFTNDITPSEFTEVVWYDANNNGVKEEGEKEIEGAEISFAKLDETVTMTPGMERDDPSRYVEDFLYIVSSAEEAGTLSTDTWKKTALKSGENGECKFDGGLIAGRYRVTIRLPETLGLPYNSTTYTNDGDPALLVEGELGGTEKVKATVKNGTEVTQYIDIGVGQKYSARTGYGYAGGLSIRKNIDVASANDNEIILSDIEKEKFTFELQLAQKPEGTEEGGVISVTVETFDLDIKSGSEVPASEDMVLKFKSTGDMYGPTDERWSAVFQLTSGQRITVPNVNANTKYWLWEYDNENKTDSLNQQDKNGSSEETDDLKYMPKGYALSKLIGSYKMREGTIPSTSRTVLVSYTNVYNPLPAEAYGGNGETVGSEYTDKWDKALEIEADVKIESADERIKRYYQAGDQFKLLLEPIEGKSNDGTSTIDIPTFNTAWQIASATPEEITAGKADSVTAKFTDGSYAVFTQEGTYRYLLREARPFYDDGVAAIPGISYAPEQYRLTISVKHEYGQLKIESVNWEKKVTDTWEVITSSVQSYLSDKESIDNPIVFTNIFNPYQLDIKISGKKILDSAVTDVTLNNLPQFTFTLQPAGVKEDRSVEEYKDEDSRDEEDFNISSDVLKSQPMPENLVVEGDPAYSADFPIAKTINSLVVGEDGDNVIFDKISFTAENAGADRAHAAVYKYLVKEMIPDGATTEKASNGKITKAVKDGITYDLSEQSVYIRVYKEIEDDVNGNQMQIVVAEMCDATGGPSSFNDDFIFTNKYEAKAEVSLGKDDLGLTLKKTIITADEGAENRGFQAKDEVQNIKADRFIFMLEPQNGAPEVENGTLDFTYGGEEAVKSADKRATLQLPYVDGTITFNNVGEYQYTLREINPLLGEVEEYTPIIGFSYDSTEYTITIVVENEKVEPSGTPVARDPAIYDGKLTARISKITKQNDGIPETIYPDASGSGAPCEKIEFENVYSPYSESVTIKGEKVLSCADPTVTLDKFVDEDENGLFQFKLTPGGSAKLTTNGADGTLEFKTDDDQPMPDETTGEKTVSNIGTVVDFGKITFNLDDIDHAEGGTTEDPLIYRYKVEELLEDEPGSDEIRNAVTAAGVPIPGTMVEESDEFDTDPNVRYVYFKVYNQRQDGKDHVVVTRCDSKGEEIAATTDFTITNDYQPQDLDVPLSGLINVQKKLTNDVKDQPLPDSTEFQIAVEALEDARLSTGSSETMSATAAANLNKAAGESEPVEFRTAEFDLSSVSLTFDKAGTYEYTLRELDPFLGDDADIVPGVIYDTYRYKLVIDVVNDLAEGKLKVEKTSILYSTDNGITWLATDGLIGSDHEITEPTHLSFINHYKGSSANLRISGYKVLDGAQNMKAGDYSFTMEAVGTATLSGGTSGRQTFNADGSMPLPNPPAGLGLDSGEAKNGENITDTSISTLSRGEVDFGTLTFTEEQAGDSALKAKIYHYQVKETIPKDAQDIDGKKVKDNVTYDTTVKDLYVRVYKIEVADPLASDRMIQAVVAEFCDADGKTGKEVASDFTFTNVYTAPALSVPVNDLLSKKIQKELTVKAGTFTAPDDDAFSFAFYPTSYPQLDAPMPFAPAASGENAMIPRLIRKIDASSLTGSDGTLSTEFDIADKDTQIAFDSAGTFTYRIRELNPDIDTDVEPKITALADVAYDTNFYTLKVVVSYNNAIGLYEISETELTDSTGKVIARRLLQEESDGGRRLQEQANDAEGNTIDGQTTLVFSNIYTAHRKLTYDENVQGDAEQDHVYDVPSEEMRVVGSEENLSTQIPVYLAGDSKRVLFVGWSTERVSTILTKTDNVKLPPLASEAEEPIPANLRYDAGGEFAMPNDDVTLYAVWSYDENGDGVADVLEKLYALTYNENTIEGEIVSGTMPDPNPVPDLLAGETVPLSETVPMHSDVEKDGKATKVLFIGWTTEDNKENKILDRTDPLPVTIKDDSITMPKPGKNVKLYAAWGYDENGNDAPDVFETEYTLIYAENAQKDGEVNDMPNPNPVTELLDGQTVTLTGTPSHSAVAPDKDSASVAVVFAGWSETKTDKIYREGEGETLPERVDSLTIDKADATVYAVWGYDRNNNGKADVLETLYTLSYDGNKLAAADNVYNVPSAEQRLPGVSDALSGNRPDYVEAGRHVLFIGWSEHKVGKILTEKTEDKAELDNAKPYYEPGASFLMPNDPARSVTLYAIWGYDTNGDGVADVLDDQHTLTYNGNARTGGTVVAGTVPGMEYHLKDDQFLLSGIIPEHSAVDVEDGSGGNVRTELIFVGWSEDREAAQDILSRNSAVPDPSRYYRAGAPFMMPGNDVTLYAIWGYDTNGDRIADVLETKYTLYYKGNPVTETQPGTTEPQVSGIPADETGHLSGDRAALTGGRVAGTHEATPPIPTHTNAKLDGEDVSVVFIGWTPVKTEKIYSKDSERAPVTVSEVTFGRDDITVYAAWGYDTDEDDIPDVMEAQYTLTYHENVQESGEVTGMPEPKSISGILDGSSLTLSDAEPSYTLPGGDPVIFLGWSETQTAEIYDVEDNAPLMSGGKELELLHPGDAIKNIDRNINLYAVWAKDANDNGPEADKGNGIPDYQEGLLIYDGCPVDGMAWDLPAREIHELYSSVGKPAKVTLASGEANHSTHSELDGRKIVFIGWMSEIDKPETGIIYKRYDTAPACVTEVEMGKPVTVYAAWGYDDNNNGVADVLETKHTLTYEGNPLSGGKVTGTPAQVNNLLDGETVVLHDGRPVFDEDGNLSSTPAHSDVQRDGVQTRVLFVGWTTEKTDEILSGTDVVPANRISEVRINRADVTVYAAWGYDTNNNHVPDVLEDYKLTYAGNGIEGSVTDMPVPNPVAGLIDGQTVELHDGKPAYDGSGKLISTPAHDNVTVSVDGIPTSVPVLFVGWTRVENAKIYSVADEVPDCVDSVTMDQKEITVYAAWSYDTNGNHVPDVFENYTLRYDGNPISGTERNVRQIPEDVTGLNYGVTVTLADGETVPDTETPTPLPVHDAVDEVPVVFIGWTEAATTDIYTRYGAAPDCIKDVVMLHNNVTVYAAWGYDTNDNGTADVLENYSLSYDGNAQQGKTVENLPRTMTGLLEGETGPLSDRIPTHASALLNGEDVAVVFIGWTKEKQDRIFAGNDTAPACEDSFTIGKADATVYAAWGWDEDNSGIADVLENCHLVYDGNPVLEGVNPDTLPEDNNPYHLYDAAELASSPVPRHDEAGGRKVVFLGWSETKTEKIYSAEDDAETVKVLLTDKVVIDEKVVTVYAVWGYDENGNGTPDVFEERHRLLYDAHPLVGQVTGGVPMDEQLYLSGSWVDLSDEKPQHSDVEERKVVFAGWSEEQMAMIYRRRDESLLPAIRERVQIGEGDKTVYAIWGYDENDDGTADVLETKYTLYYRENPQRGGIVSDMPESVGDLLKKETVAVSGKIPRHSEVDGRKIVFVGWTQKQVKDRIYKKGEAAPATVKDSVTIPESGADVELFAAWGYDTNDNGVADVLEELYELKYDGNAQPGDEASDVPEPLKDLLEKEPVTLSTEQPAYEAADGRKVVFAGWTEEKTGKILDKTDVAPELVDEVTMPAGDKTVYAAWGCDVNNNGVADVLEAKYTLSYDKNVRNAADNAVGVPAAELRLWNETLPLSETEPAYIAADRRRVLFIGWSLDPVEQVLAKTDTAEVPAGYYEAGDPFTMPNADTTLYAIWGYDENNDGTPDVLEGMHELRYDGNAPAGEIGNMPGLERRLAGATFNLSEKKPTREAVNVDGVQTDVLFAGWSTQQTDVLGREDFGKLPGNFYAAGAEYTMPDEDTRLYAVWSYDTNGDGTPDALEERYHVFYDVNPVKGGVDGNPSDRHDYLTNERAVLADGVTVKDADDSLIPLPTHENLTLNGQEEKVVFIGWTRVKTAEVYTQESVRAPVTVASVTFGKDDITVYAAWGYDANDNGVPDVMERQFILTYHGNAQEDGVVSGMPDPASVTGILLDTSVKLSDKIPAHTIPSGDAVLFEGWSTTQTGKIFDVTDTDPLTVDGRADGVRLVIPKPGAAVEEAEDNLLLAPGTVIEKVRGNINLYAVWAKDVDHDGVPDYKEGLLEYAGNPIEGMTGDLPESEVHPLKTKTALSKEQPTHSDVEHRKVVFIGWTLEETDRIYDREDHDSQPECVSEAVVTKRTKVYAAWGYDLNNNGTADVLEEQYTLSYDGNAQKGTFSKLPEPVSGLLDRETVTLADGKTVTDASGAVIPLPEHSPLMLDGKETKVLFVGWTLTPADRIYTIDDEPPADLVTDVTILHADRTVYAAWGYDATENNIPDILENYVLQYNGNALIDSVWNVPDQVSNLKRGDVVELVDGETVADASGRVIPAPTHSQVDGSAVLFLGWTTEENHRIYEAGDTAPACVTEAVMNNRLVTVYAAWGFDRDGKGIPDVYEDYTLFYDGNEIVRGAVHNVPRKEEGLSYGDKVPLKNAEGAWLAAPEHDPFNGVAVVFVGWTKERTSVIYSRYDDAPECLEEAVMDRREVTVYAAWGLDTNGNGTADVLENYSLFYEGNAKGGTVGNLPLSVTGLLADETVTLSPRQPTHTPVEQNGVQTKVLFLGWTDQPTRDIFSSGDIMPELLTEVTLRGADRTVYAAWGYDMDDSGTPDVWENYTLIYHGNEIRGNVDESTLPPAEQHKRNEPVTLSEETPKHETVNGRTVAFLGWTLEPTDRIYERGDDREAILQRLATSVIMETRTVDVYAAWGYDENGGSENPGGGNGTADVLENTYLLTYNGNPLIGDADDIPVDQNGYLVNERITLSTKTPTHSDVEGRTVVFLGWTLEPSPMIYEGAGEAAAADAIATGADGPLPELIDTVEMEEGGMTVYAAWGYVTNQVNLPLTMIGKKVVKAGKEPYMMQGGEFGFAVIPAPGNLPGDPVEETRATNDADGNIPLISAVYRETGTYQYTIEELGDSGIPGMQYDDSVYELTVTVTGSGREAQADVAIMRNGRTAESILFENTYAPAVASVSIEGRKTLAGRDLESGEFTFTLEPVSAEVEEEAEEIRNPLSTVTAGEDEGTELAAENAAEPETERESVNETESESSAESESESSAESESKSGAESESSAELVLACPYMPHAHTDDCFDESGALVCGYADYVVHTHNEDCYDKYGNLVCLLPELEEHKHDESCYERKEELVCGLTEGNGHTHSDSCYAVDTTLICGLEETPGHTHSDSCYTVDTMLICGLEESAGHYHDEYCYDTDGNLICGWEESAGHYHTDSCYQKEYRLVCGQEERPAHYHTDSCYEKNTYLTCGMEEAPAHVHDESCYLSVQQCDKPEIELHRHGKKCYKRVYDEEKDEWQKVLVCGKLEVLEHVHGPECFKTVELSSEAVQAEDTIQDGSGQVAAEASEDGAVPVQDGNTAVVAGGLQVLSVEVVPMETSSQPTPQTVTEAASESETATEVLTEAVSESETATEPAAEGQPELQTLALDEAMQQANELTVTRTLDVEDIPMPASPEAQNTAAGVFRFGAIEYTKPGVYTYRISEKNTKAEGIVFDETVYYATVTVTEEQPGILRSAAEIRTEAGDVVPDAVFANTYLPPVLGITKTQSVNDGPILEETQNVYGGDKITYYLTVTNSAAEGAAAAKEVVVSDTIPSGLELVEDSISDGGKPENRVITWELGDISAGESRTVSFCVTAPQVQTNIVRTNIANVRAANNPLGANVWSGSNVVRINVLASRPKDPDTPPAEEPPQTERENQGSGSGSETESESENKTTEKEETETDDADAIVPSASDGRNSGGGLGSSSSGGSNGGTATASAAKTGDETNVICWLTLMLMSGAVLSLLLARSRNHRNASGKE